MHRERDGRGCLPSHRRHSDRQPADQRAHRERRGGACCAVPSSLRLQPHPTAPRLARRPAARSRESPAFPDTTGPPDQSRGPPPPSASRPSLPHCTASLTRTRPLQRTRRHGAGGPCWPAGRLIPIDPTRRNGLRSIEAKVRRRHPSRATGRCHQRAVRRACLVPHSERRTPNERAAAGSTKADPPLARVNRPYFSTPRSRPTSRADHRRPLRAAPLCPTARPHSRVLCAQQRPRRHGAGGPCRPAGRLIPIDPTRRIADAGAVPQRA